MLRRTVKSILKFFGLELHSLHRIEEKDAFLDQKLLLNGMKTPVIFDVGAYIGEITAKYNTLFPKATIYSLEPFPESFKKLQEKFKANSLVKPFQLGMSDKTGTKEFYVNPDRSCNSLFPRLDVKAESRVTIEANVSTIDDFCKKQSIPRINILKLDVEGAELIVLKGAHEKLTQKSIDLIYTEVMFVHHYEGGVIFYELYSFLSDYGYTLFDFYELKRAENGQLRWGNAIFVSPRIKLSVIDVRTLGGTTNGRIAKKHE